MKGEFNTWYLVRGVEGEKGRGTEIQAITTNNTAVVSVGIHQEL